VLEEETNEDWVRILSFYYGQKVLIDFGQTKDMQVFLYYFCPCETQDGDDVFARFD